MARVRRLGIVLVRSFQRFSIHNGGLLAAAISYWALFSLFPLLLLFAGLFAIFLHGSALEDSIIDAILRYLPFTQDQGREEVTRAIRGVSRGSGGVFGAIGFVVAAWSSSSMFAAIRRSLDIVFGGERRRPPVQEKLQDLAMVLALAPLFLSSVAATALLRVAQRTSESIPILGSAASGLGVGWVLVSTVTPLVISFAAYATLYLVSPANRPTFRCVWPGALLAAISFELSKLAFSIYLENFGTYELIYGSLGLVLALFFWVFLASNILVLGAEFASEYAKGVPEDLDAGTRRTRQSRGRSLWGFVQRLFVLR